MSQPLYWVRVTSVPIRKVQQKVFKITYATDDSTAPRTQHMALLMEDHIQGRKGEETRFLFLYLMGWERSGHLIWAGGLFNVQLAGGCS